MEPSVMTTTSSIQDLAARVVDLRKQYGVGGTLVTALDGVSLDVRAGEFTAVMGPSGSGKSTLIHCMAALDSPTSGQIVLGGVDISHLGDKELTRLRRDKVGFVFQAYNLVPTLNARENIELPAAIAGRQRRPRMVRHRHRRRRTAGPAEASPE